MPARSLNPVFANRPTTIFAVMSALARKHGAVNLGQGRPDFDGPPEVIEAIAANLTILKSPTVMRQYDGRLWNFEGCGDTWGCCHGSCTHVWNYAQAMPHLFPALERTLTLIDGRRARPARRAAMAGM